MPHLYKQTTANGLGPLLINESQDYLEYKVGETDPSPEALNTVNSITQGAAFSAGLLRAFDMLMSIVNLQKREKAPLTTPPGLETIQ